MRRSIVWRAPSARWCSAVFGSLLAAACARATPAVPGPGPAAPPMVRVGILVDTTEVQLGATTNLEIINGMTGEVIHRLPPGQTAVVRATLSENLVVSAPAAEVTVGDMILARPENDGFVSIGGRPYRGSAVVRASGPGRVTGINQVDLERYLLGVVPFEIGRVGPELLEAAKAQAVAARTYAIRYLGRRDSLGFDVFATVEDQVYGGAEGEHDPISEAVRQTTGEILTYDGEPILAYYHSTCAGQTAAIDEVWPDPPQPYLVSVVDINPATGEAWDATSSRFRWTQVWSADELEQIFARTLADSLLPGVTDVGEIEDMEVLFRTQSGRIGRMRISTSTADFYVGRDRIRWIFLTPSGSILNSSKFDVRLERDAQGRVSQVIAEGMGWGHGIGMCQVGAMNRARAGQDYRTILHTYYPGTELTRLY